MLDLIQPSITTAENEFHIQHPSNNEIKAAMFSLGNNKSPSPYGITTEFYKKYWDIVGTSIIRVVNGCFHFGKILKQINHTFISLLPNRDNPTTTSHYRPISLCSTLYKII